MVISRADVEREIVAEAIGNAFTPTLFTPQSGKQTQAYESPADILGYGGSAGGGKSFLEIGLAVTQHRRSIIFRREADQTRDLWDKLSEVCGIHGRSNENLLVWRDLPGGRYVRLAGVKNEGDWKKYQGQGHDLHAFDEATEFSEAQVRTLIAWNRTTLPDQRCRVVLAFNPPTTPEGLWIIDFFAPWLDPKHPNPAEPGELRWFAVVDGADVAREDGSPFEWNGETIYPLSRTFIPARLEDNPILEDTGYRRTLQGLPEPLRSQMLYGDFSIGLQDDIWQVIPTAWVRAAQDRWHDDGHDGTPQQAVGMDVAQGGADRTVLTPRHGVWFGRPQVHPGHTVQDANANAALALRALIKGGVVNIDCDGIGAATYHLAFAKVGNRVRAYLGSAPSDMQDQSDVLSFANTRAAAWWKLREMLDPSTGSEIALPPDRNLLAELTAPRYKQLTNGIQLEKKDDTIKRTGRSPDLADSVVMAAWNVPGADVGAAFASAASGAH